MAESPFANKATPESMADRINRPQNSLNSMHGHRNPFDQEQEHQQQLNVRFNEPPLPQRTTNYNNQSKNFHLLHHVRFEKQPQSRKNTNSDRSQRNANFDTDISQRNTSFNYPTRNEYYHQQENANITYDIPHVEFRCNGTQISTLHNAV